MRGLVMGALGLAAVAAAAIALNLLLLGYSAPPGEPVGKLSPALPVKVVTKPPRLAPARHGEERDD